MGSLLFNLGQLVTTPTIQEFLTSEEIIDLVLRHGALERGELCEEDYQANFEAFKNGERIFSVFLVHGKKVYVITEWDRSATTVLFASEY